MTASGYRTQNWQVRKPGASGRDGVVVAQSRDAAEAGAAVLRAGGNAADAAVATAFALAAVEPWNSGLGGIGFGLVMRAEDRVARVVDFGPVSPGRTDAADYPLTGRVAGDLFGWPEVRDDRNVHGPLAFCVPSSVAGYDTLRREFGSGLPVADLLAPAIALARRGLPQDWFTTLKVASSAPLLRRYAESARIYLPDGLPPVPPYQGAPGFLPLGSLPATLERLAAAGLRDFYEGDLAADLLADLREAGSVLEAADLAGCRAIVRDAEPIGWRGRAVLQTPGGLTAAPTLARVVAAMETVPAGDAPDAVWFAALASAMRDAYAARLAGLGAAAAPDAPADACTTHLTVVDRDGTIVSLTTTLLSSMGSRVVLPRTGVLMNNGMMWFDPRPGTPNAIAPAARPLCNMCPVIAAPSDGGWPRIGAGASGGRRILASVYQVLAFALDFGMDPETAAHAPRIDVSGPDLATADAAIAPAVIEALAAGGALEVLERGVMPINFACPNLVRAGPDGQAGCSDVASPWSAAVAA